MLKKKQTGSNILQTKLDVNTAKTKIMDLTNKPDVIKLKDHVLEKVTSFTYLGSKITASGDTSPEIATRIALASSAFNKLANIWKSGSLSNHTKLKIFNSCVIPVLTYGCESWKSSVTIDKKLVAFENKCLRKLLNVRWTDFRSNASIRQETKQKYVSDFVRMRRWNYIGHVLRMDMQRLPHQAFMWSSEGKRKQGRPKETLRRTIARECATIGLNRNQDLQQVATNRLTWKAMTSALCAIFGTRGKTN